MEFVKDLPLGWMSPTGEMISCASFAHISTAKDICHRMQLPFDHADEALLNAGWVHISVSELDYALRIGWRNFLTEEQKIALKPYFEGPREVFKYDKERFLLECGEHDF